jgi:hypothetical protein
VGSHQSASLSSSTRACGLKAGSDRHPVSEACRHCPMPPSPRLTRPLQHLGLRPRPPRRRSDRRVEAPRRCHGPKPRTAAVRNPCLHRPAMLRLRESPMSSPTSLTAPPSSVPMRSLPCPLPLHRSATPPSCRRSGAAAARARSHRGHAHATQAGAKLGQAVGRAPTAQLGRGRFGPLASDLLCYFLYIFKSMQIQKFVQDSFELKKL